MNPIDLGNSVSLVQWENENELRAYPFDSESADIPRDIIADLSIMVSDSYDSEFRLRSVHVSQAMVSVSFFGGPFFLVCTVHRSDFEPYRPYSLTSEGACGGVCSFGDVDFSKSYTAKFGRLGPKVLDNLVSRIHIGELKSFVYDATGEEVSGDVGMTLSSGVEASIQESRPNELHLGLSKDLEFEVTPCFYDKSDLYVGDTSPVKSINGVTPNADGKLAIVFK